MLAPARCSLSTFIRGGPRSSRGIRLHFSSCIVLLPVTAAFLIVNVPGDKQWHAAYRHGWPATYVDRSGAVELPNRVMSIWPWVPLNWPADTPFGKDKDH